MAEELTKILSYIDQLKEVDVRGFEEHAAGVTPMRDDVPRPSVDRDLVARNAPAWSDGHFVVPAVIGNAATGRAAVPAAGAAASPPPLDSLNIFLHTAEVPSSARPI